jgi:hypothetical protein
MNLEKYSSEYDILHFHDVDKPINDELFMKKKKLIEIAKNLSNIEYREILNIIKEDKCTYTENANGVFINLMNVKESTINKIFYFLDFIKHKKEDLIKHEEIMDTAKKNIGTINKEQENDSKISDNNQELNQYDSYYDESENEKEDKNYLSFSSDEDDDLENKLSLKKKKLKYSGKKAKIIKSIKDSNENYKSKNKIKKGEEK